MFFAFASLFSYVFSALCTSYFFAFTTPWIVAVLYSSAGGVFALFYLLLRGKLRTGYTEFKENWRPIMFMLSFGCIDGLAWFFSIYYNGLSGHAILSRLLTLVLIGYGVAFLKERLSRPQIISCLLIVSSSFLYAFQLENTDDLLGIIVILVQVTTYCIFAIQQKKLADKIYPAFMLGMRSCLLGGVALLIATASGEIFNLSQTPWPIILGIFCAGIFGNFLNHYFAMRAMEQETLSIVAAIRNTNPIFLFIFGVFILGEGSTPIKWLAAVLMTLGVVLLIIERAPLPRRFLWRRSARKENP